MTIPSSVRSAKHSTLTVIEFMAASTETDRFTSTAMHEATISRMLELGVPAVAYTITIDAGMRGYTSLSYDLST